MKKERLARATPQPTTYEVTVKNAAKPGLNDIYKPKAPLINLAADADEEEDAADDAPANDIVLKEAQNILLDYSNILKGKTVAKQN